MIEITYELGDFIETVQHDSDGVKVLEAFMLKDSLLNKEFWFKVASRLSLTGSIENPRDVDRVMHGHREAWGEMQAALFRPYDRMIACVKPFTTLTIPADLLSEPREDVLAVNLSDRERLDLKVLAKVIGEVEALYDAVNRVFGRADAAPLQIIKIESGSSLRIDLKGLADTIKELKNAVLEIWNKHRHKKADEIIDQHRVVSSGIEVLTQIDVRVKKKELTDEDGNRFRRAIVQSTLGLFKNGALIDEIPPTEIVDNVKLLGGFAYRLLAAPREDSESDQGVEIAPLDLGGALLTAAPQKALPPSAIPKPTQAQRKSKKNESKKPSARKRQVP